MPTNHASRAAFPVDASLASKTLARNLLVGRYPYFVADGESPQDLVAIDPDTGAVSPALLYLQQMFWLDPLDTTTAHDGITTIVSYDGLRYKIADSFGSFVFAENTTTEQNTQAALYWAQLHRYRTPFTGSF